MMRVPGTGAIEAAELRHRLAVADMHAAARHSVEAGRAALTRPSTLALAAMAGIACGLRRTPSAGDSPVPAPGIVAVVLAFALRYGMQRGANAFFRAP